MAGADTAGDGPDTRLLRGLMHARLFEDESPPPRLGRFVVEQRLGAGGMGVVYAARDTDLDRRVAIKLLSCVGDGDELTARLRREAQAMARLAHPNVVAVFEVGSHDGAAFVAMELVDGPTLTRWLVEPGRTRAEVLAAFSCAGAGLTAAHEAGLVHRDFKPDNVLVGRDGRPRVGDFGLVRGLGSAALREVHGDSMSPTNATQSSELAGTPAYMAPELFEGEPASASSDQYAFCVALYEALCGVRPHEIGSFAALVEARLAGVVVFPKLPRLPPALRRLLARGLHRHQSQRYPTMRVLLTELDRVRRPVHRAWIGGGLVAATGVAIAMFSDKGDPSCARGAEAIARGWDEEHRARVHAAIVDDDPTSAYSAGVAERVGTRLDAWTEEWREAQRVVCEAAEGGASTGELVRRQMLCLDRRRLERDALIGALEGSTAAVTARALQAAAALPSAVSCTEEQSMLDDVAPPPDEIAESVAEVRARLAEAKSTLEVGADADAALAIAQNAVERADVLGYAPLSAEADLRLAATTVAKGDFPTAEGQLEHAYFAAIAAGHEIVAMQAAASLLHTIGVKEARPADALVWWNHGDALLRKRGPSPRESYQLGNAYAAVLSEQGKHAEALAVARQSVADADAGYGPEHPNALNARQNVAGAHLGLGEYAEALAVYEDVVARLERMYGEDHPAVASAMANNAIALGNLGRHAEALEHHQRALAIFERTIGGDTREAGFTLANMGNIQRRLGDHEAALASMTRAQDALVRALGPDHPRAVMIGGNIGHILLSLGRLDDARTALQTTIDALTRIDPKSAELPNNYDRLGLVELALGDCERSAEHHRRAFELASALNLPAFTLAFQQLNLGVAWVCLGRHEDAIAELERARAAWVAENPKVRAKQIDDAERSLAAAHLQAGRAEVALAMAEDVLARCAPPICTDERRADALVLVAEARLVRGRLADARVAADEALTIRERVGGNAWARGDAHWVAAQIRHASGERGAELAVWVDRARAILRDAGPRGEAMLATWPAWTRP